MPRPHRVHLLHNGRLSSSSLSLSCQADSHSFTSVALPSFTAIVVVVAILSRRTSPTPSAPRDSLFRSFACIRQHASTAPSPTCRPREAHTNQPLLYTTSRHAPLRPTARASPDRSHVPYPLHIRRHRRREGDASISRALVRRNQRQCC